MAKINPADAEAQEYLALQHRKAPINRASDLILITILALMIAVTGIAIFILPHKTFSEDENRSLETFPRFSLSSLANGEWTEGVTAFYSDQFPGRRLMVELKAAFELAQLKGQNNGVILGANGTLVKRLEYNDDSIAKRNLEAVADIRSTLADEGIPVYLAIAPRSIDVLKAELPALYGADRSDAIWSSVLSYEPDAARYRDILCQLADAGEYVWYKTDHHWTTDGAYAAYAELGAQLGFAPYAKEDFERVAVSTEFYGTTYSSSGMYFVAPDTMHFYRFEGDEEYVVENVLTGKRIEGFYDTQYLDKKDKYSALIGGNNAHVRVFRPEYDDDDKPTLVLVKDSYAHSLVPFLARHFKLEIIDLRSYTGSVAKLAREKGAVGVLVLSGIDNLASSDSLTLLRYGLASAKN